MSAPSTFGPYLLYRRLAVGGMAEIFLAKAASGDGRWLALKVMLPHNAGNAEHESMFSDEARLLLSIKHPNIVSAFDFVRVDDRIAVALEFVPGNDLSILLRKMRETQTEVPIALALEIGMGVAAGLHHAHTLIADDGEPLYLVHRDVSPENILLGVDGSIKVADFGVAKARGMKQVETKTGIIKGKLRYMAPEYATGNMQDVRSDIFSLALCLFELLTGAPAYDDNTLGPELVESIKYARIPKLRTLRPECPPLLERLLLKALAVSPMDRFTTAESMRRAFDKVLQQVPPSPVSLAEFLISLGLEPVMPAEEDAANDAPAAIVPATAELEPTGQMSVASHPPLRGAKPELVSLTGYRQSIVRDTVGETKTAAVVGHQHPSRTSGLAEIEVEFEALDDHAGSGDSYDEIESAETSRLDASFVPPNAVEPVLAAAPSPIALFEDAFVEALPNAAARYAIAPTSESVALEPTDAFAVLPPTGAMPALASAATGAPRQERPLHAPPATVAAPAIGVKSMNQGLHRPMMTDHTPVIPSAPVQRPSQNFSAPPSSGPKSAPRPESDEVDRPAPPKYSPIFVKLAAIAIFVILAMMFVFWITF
jgi:serine/threonine protein kinase